MTEDWVEELREGLESRYEDWLRSTSAFYADRAGAEAYKAGLVGYLLRGPGALNQRLAPVIAFLEEARDMDYVPTHMRAEADQILGEVFGIRGES